MATPTFQNFGNNLVVKKADYRMAGVFTDANNLINLFSDDIRSTHMGVLSAWNQWSLISTPLLSMTELQNNTIYLNGNDGEMTFNMPYQLDGVSVKEEFSTDIARPGMDGQTFEICLGDGNLEPTFQVGTRITPDFRDGQNLLIVGVNSAPVGQGFLYSVRLVTNDRNEYFDKKWLAVGTQYFRISGTVNEFDEKFAGIDNSFGMMKLKHQLGGGRGVEYTITGDAYRLNLQVGKNQGNVSGLDFVMNKANSLTPNDPGFYMAIGEGNGKLGTDGMQGFKPGTVTWMNMVDALLLKQLMLDEERDLMWARGGLVTGARNKSIIVGEGLYNQMKRGNWVKLPRYSKQALMNAFGQVFRNRPDIPDYMRRFKLQGGRGAVMELQRIFQEQLNTTANQAGAVIQAADLGIVKKVGEINGVTQLSTGFRMQSAFISGLGWLEIEHNPAFDSQYSRSEDEPYIGGFPRHSYTSAIFDVTDSASTNAAEVTSQVEFAKGVDKGANVYLVRNAAMPGNKMTYINGRTSKFPISAGGGSVASTRFDGYTTMIENRSNIWLKDPTKSILFEISAPY
jgi:hypothetical protein